MKASRVLPKVLALMVLVALGVSLRAEEKAGLLVEISKKVVARNDKVTVNGIGTMSVDRDMTLKLDIKNVANKDLPETPIESVILVERWGFSERSNIERYTGTAKIEALHPAQTTSVQVGDFHIGGHMHGSSEMHVDHVIGWKVTLTRDGQKVEFTSGANFESVNRRAKDGSRSS